MGIPYSGGTDSRHPVIDATACGRCGKCAAICPSGCLAVAEREIAIDRKASIGCIGCGHCMMVCPNSAITVTGRRAEHHRLVDLPPVSHRATADQFEAMLLARRSVRKFADREVPRELINRVLRMAATAPMGLPPSDVGAVVFHGKDKVRDLAFEAIDVYAGLMKMLDHPAGRFLSRFWMSKVKRELMYNALIPLGHALVEAKARGEDLALYGAPAAILFHASPYADGADVHIVCTYAMLAAESLGLGGTMIGCVPGPLAHRKDILAKYGIPADHSLGAALILGYPGTTFARTIQRDLGFVRYA